MSPKIKSDFSEAQVERIAHLAQIPITTPEKTSLAKAFSTTLTVINILAQVAIVGVEPTHHVTGLVNITREDVVEEKRMFSQTQALANAPKSYQGFFVVPRIIDRDAE